MWNQLTIKHTQFHFYHLYYFTVRNFCFTYNRTFSPQPVTTNMKVLGNMNKSQNNFILIISRVSLHRSFNPQFAKKTEKKHEICLVRLYLPMSTRIMIKIYSTVLLISPNSISFPTKRKKTLFSHFFTKEKNCPRQKWPKLHLKLYKCLIKTG